MFISSLLGRAAGNNWRCISRQVFLGLRLCIGILFLVQAVRFDVVDHGSGYQVLHAHLSSQKQADLGAGDVVLDELLCRISYVVSDRE